jgi:hypothetical protein
VPTKIRWFKLMSDWHSTWQWLTSWCNLC